MAIYSPKPSSLDLLLKDKRYEVPVYQRPYSWTTDDAGELWSDIRNNEAPYFLGILVFEKTDIDRKFKVVDGQQRLATLMLLLRAAVEVLGSDDKLGKELQDKYIDQKGWGEEKSEFTLTLSERDKYNFASLLDEKRIYLAPELSPKEKKKRGKTVSSTKLNKVKEFFLENLRSLKEAEGSGGIISFIQKKVLPLSFIEVQLQDENDIFLFFETLNARGVDLTIADLLKNRVCRESDDQYEAANKIDEISYILSEGKMNSFLLHYCLALSEEKDPRSKKKLMPWYSETIKNEKDEFLVNLKNYAEIYATFVDPKKCNNVNERVILNYLKVLGATRCYPLLLVGRKYLSTKEFLKLCKVIETLTFRHSTIVGRDAKVLEEAYFNLSKNIRNKKNLNFVIGILNKKAKEIPDELFLPAFKNYIPANNQIAKYILLKLDDYLSKQSSELDWDSLTLEHILAEKADWEGKEEFLERLGNMVLLKDTLNKTVGNKSFKLKKGEYKNEKRIILTQELNKYDDFTKETIEERQTYLAELASKVWNPENLW